MACGGMDLTMGCSTVGHCYLSITIREYFEVRRLQNSMVLNGEQLNFELPHHFDP